MADKFKNVENTVEDTFNTVEGEVEGYFFGSSNFTNIELNEDGEPIYAEDPEDTDCAYLMKDDIEKYWGVVGAMIALFVASFVLPWLLCCCGKRWPRCASRFFFWMGVTEWICGALLASVLMPNCLQHLCGAQFCSAHKYNPGQVWGGVVVGLGFILQMKACGFWRQARRQENERNLASQAEKGALVSTIDTMMDESQRGYKDRPDNELI